MTRNQFIQMFGSEKTYNTVKAIVLDATGKWYEDAGAITAQTSMFSDEDTVPNTDR